MSNQKILIPSDLFEQSFWKEQEFFSSGQAFIDLVFLTNQTNLTVQKEFLLNRWNWGSLDHLFEIPYFQKYFLVEQDNDFLTISRKNQKKVNVTREQLVDDLAGRILIYFNEVFGTRYRNAAAWIRGLEYWAQYYSEEEILEAIRRARADDFWSDKMNPIILFRKKNPQGQDVDYIGTLLNKKVRSGKNLFDRVM